MSVGNKIRAIRTLRNMTQKDLGLASGFSATTADVRIRQYESNKMVPKEDKLNEIANALGVDPTALKDHDIYSDLDFMQTLFEMEETFGLNIDKKEDGYILSLDPSHPLYRFLNYNLDSWYQAKKNLSQNVTDDNANSAKNKYDLWKYRFPLDNEDAEKSSTQKIQEKYQELIKTRNEKYSQNTVKDFIILFEKLIRSGFDIEISTAPERSGIGVFVCCVLFKNSQILEADGEAADNYADYLCMINFYEQLGIEIERNNYSYDGDILSCVYFHNSTLSTALNHTVREMIKAIHNGIFTDELVQMQYKDSLQTFNVKIEDYL